MQPNAIDFDYVFDNADFLSNPTLYVTEMLIVIAYVAVAVWARRTDKQDIKKVTTWAKVLVFDSDVFFFCKRLGRTVLTYAKRIDGAKRHERLVNILLSSRTERRHRCRLLQLGVTPLADNDIRDRYLYEVQVSTGSRKNAATDSNVRSIQSLYGHLSKMLYSHLQCTST